MSKVEIQTSAVDNPKMKEIYDILLMAGYFRIRIPSIKDFDKIMGGLTWCIICSNFEIDIEYNDEMKLGEKIKLSEKICNVLKQMKCPFQLQPFQIQGLDANAIYPIIQWLIKFVYETRELRQDFNQKMSNFVGKSVFKSFEENEVEEKQAVEQIKIDFSKGIDKRLTKNSKIRKTSKKDPLRIYSTLIEYGDVTAFKTYNKLCAIMSGKISLEDRKGKLSQQVSQFEQQQQKDEKSAQEDADVNSILFHGSSATEKLEKTQRKISEGDNDFMLDEEQLGNFKNIGGQVGNIGQQLMQLIDSEEINKALTEQEKQEDEDDPLNMAKLIQNENHFHEGQIQAMNKKIAQLEKQLEELSDELYTLKDNEESKETEYQKHLQLYEQLGEAQNTLQQKVDQEEKKHSSNSEQRLQAERLVEQKTELEEKQKLLKRQIKAEKEQLENDRLRAEQEIPQWNDNEEYFKQLYLDVQDKKEKYDEKFKQLAELNQQIAVLQRKLEAVPSPTEISQYHQRLQELFENINQENLKYKDKFIQFNGATDIKDMLAQFVEIMRTFKENFGANRKSKSGRENFIGELAETRKAMLTNLQKSNEFYRKQIQTRDDKASQLAQFQSYEREYYKLLKDLRIEFERGDELQDAVNKQQQYVNQQ